MQFVRTFSRTATGIALTLMVGCAAELSTPTEEYEPATDDGSRVGRPFGDSIDIAEEELASGGMCSPCSRNSDCNPGAYCLSNLRSGGRFCGGACTSNADCGAGGTCASIFGVLRQCVPTSGSCTAGDAGAPRLDAGTVARDAGTVARDAGTVARDAGTVARDAGASAPADAGTAVSGCSDARVIEELRLTNEARAANGLGALSCDERLLAVALAHSRDMCERAFFDHTNPDGLDPFARMRAAGISYRTAGENIAYGYATPAAVHEGWMNSSGHRANILNGGFGRIGIGVWACGSRLYWTQTFTN